MSSFVEKKEDDQSDQANSSEKKSEPGTIEGVEPINTSEKVNGPANLMPTKEATAKSAQELAAESDSSSSKWFLRLGIGLLVLIILVAAAAVWLVRRPWPQMEGTAQVDKIGAPVEVVRDNWGVPHIYAESDYDLFYAQGYIEAQDRFWQMEFNRRTAEGTLSEVLGERFLPLDRFHRNMRFVPIAETSWEQLDEESRAALQAYADGVNQYLEEYENKLPLEFTILNYEPEAWTPLDTLAWGNLLTMHLSGNRRIELVRSQIVAEMGEETMEFLLPTSANDSPITIPEEANHYDGLRHVNAASMAYLSDIYGTPSQGIGSNSWVVSGEHTESGMPIVANDIHLFPSMPSIWYGAGLHGGSYNVVGFSLSGVPGIITGHNEDIAWGLTNFAPDTQDYYIERLDNRENPTQYEFEGDWRDLEVVEEVIEVKGQEPEVINIYSTHHGPIMNETLAEDGGPTGQILALRWTLHDGNLLFQAILQLNRATNWDEFRAALSNWQSPGQNALYADREGNIGYQATGKVPIRTATHQGLVPIPGWTGENEWADYIPFDEMPSIFNPANGMIVSANSKITGDNYPYYLSDSYVPGYRAIRITELLEEKMPISIQDMEAIQADTFAPTAEVLLPYLLDVAEPQNSLQERALEQVESWDLFHETDRLGPAVYDAWHMSLLRNTVADELGEETADNYLAGRYVRHATQHVPMLLDLMDDPDNPWFDDITTPDVVETRDDIVQRSFEEAVAWLSGQYGTNPANWDWGRVHSATFPHQPFGWLGNPMLDFVFNSRTYPSRGSNFSVHTNSYAWDNPFEAWIISNVRHVISLDDFSDSVMMGSSGQVAAPFHPHHEDLVKMWANAESHTMSFDRETVETNQESILILQP